MDPWEKLIKTITGTAYDPVTRVPIEINNYNLAVEELRKRESPEAVNQFIQLLRDSSGGLPVTGQYDPAKRAIKVNVNPWATYQDYRDTLAHEKMHQSMDVAAPGRELPPVPDGKRPMAEVVNYLKSTLGFSSNYAPGPIEEPTTLLQALGLKGRETPTDALYPKAASITDRLAAAGGQFQKSRAMGYLPLEYPVYMMANPGLMGATPEQSDEYTKRYVKQLPPKIGERVVKIRNQAKTPTPRKLSDFLPSGK